MTIGQSMLMEFDQEMSNTRKVLERVDDAQGVGSPTPSSWRRRCCA